MNYAYTANGKLFLSLNEAAPREIVSEFAKPDK